MRNGHGGTVSLDGDTAFVRAGWLGQKSSGCQGALEPGFTKKNTVSSNNKNVEMIQPFYDNYIYIAKWNELGSFNYGLLYWGPGKDNKKQRMSNINGDPNYGTLDFRRSFLPTNLFCQYQPSGISNSNVHKFHGGNHDRCTAIFRELHGYTGIFRS